jgi:hypothetical protein
MSIEINQKNSFNSLFKYLLFIVLLNSFNVKSQYQDYQPNIPKILPNSPNSTALGDFGKIPVNYCFGKADISIPLYEINLCGLKLPISLNYNTSGIKLSQESTWVGLGWILNAGGCITHQCIGTDDFFDYNKVPYMFSYGYLRSRIISDAASPVIFNPNNKTCVSYNYNKQDNDLYDLEPDNFDFNFAGYGGSLYFNNNPDKSIFNQQYGYEAIIKSNKEYIKAYFNKQKNSWLVFDGNGFKYYFGYNIKSIEITTGHYIPQHTVNANGEIAAKMDSNYDPISHNETSSAWYLNKIEAPNGDSIHFDYEIEEICTVPQTVEDVRIKTSSNTPSGYQNTALDRFNNYSNSNSTIHQCVLKSII